MKAPSSLLLQASERLADGADWSDLSDQLEPDLVECLRRIETLSTSMASLRGVLSCDIQLQGKRFGHLYVLSEVARGGGGVVYRARDPLLDRIVALKCARTPIKEARLWREAKALAGLDHPGVLKVHGVAEHEGVTGFWCDLLEGESLEDWSAARGRWSHSELAALGQELCAALAAIHGKGVVHGDVKPRNLVRHASGRWVLVDFGSSFSSVSGSADSGTKAYLAPEVANGEGGSPRSDLYALGVLLFYLASRTYPDDGTTSRTRLLDLRPDLPSHLVSAIESALEPDPSKRVASAGEFAAAMSARPVTRRVRQLVLAAMAVAALGVAGAVRLSAPTPPVPLVELVRISDSGDQQVADGASVQPGDEFALRYRASRDSYVYVFNEDAAGAVVNLFPLLGSDINNPVPANTDVRLPGRMGDQWLNWQITTDGGQERFFVLVTDRAIESYAATLANSKIPALSALEVVNGSSAFRGVGAISRVPAPNRSGTIAALLSELQAEDPTVYTKQFVLNPPER